MTESAMSESAMSGNAMSGNAMSGNAMSGNAMSGNAMSGNAMSGNAMSGNAMTDSAVRDGSAQEDPGQDGELPATGEQSATDEVESGDLSDAGSGAGATSGRLATGRGARPARTGRGSADVTVLEQEGEVAADYLEELLDICDLDGDLDLDVEGDRAVVAVVGSGLAQLVGDRGRVLEALQELTRLAVLAQTGERSRLMLDVAGFRAGRRAELTVLGTEAAEAVAAGGDVRTLAPMTPFERKVVHDAVAAVAGVRSESEGEEPQRRVVVLPA